jgi:hypothetical protein
MRLMCLPDDFPEIPRTKASKKLFQLCFYIIRIQQIKEKNTSTVNLYGVNI